MSTQLITGKNVARGLLVVLAIIFILLVMEKEFTAPSYTDTVVDATTTMVDTDDTIYTIQADELFLTEDMLAMAASGADTLRPYIMRQLIGHGFQHVITIPYASGNQVITSRAMGSGYAVLQPIDKEDDLDIWLAGQSFSGVELVTIPHSTWSQRTGLHLFRTTEDLQTMGYQVVSHRKRINNDDNARRFNIMQSFKLMGNVRIIMPGEQLQFLHTAQYDEDEKENYLMGYAIVEGEEEQEYGGGICGASTAIYQGILTNTGLEINQRKEHSKRFGNLYNADINHQTITTPGIDSTIWYGLIDLWITNTTPHPIILVMNYDGSANGIEEVFTLSMPAAQGSFEFISGGSRRSEKEVDDPQGTGKIMEQIRSGCYTWLINGEEQRSCYKEIR